MTLDELNTMRTDGSFDHATYRNHGTLWEGLWIDEQRVQLRARGAVIAAFHDPPADTFADDVARYTPLIAAMPTKAQRLDHLQRWAAVFAGRVRATITASEIRAQLHAWKDAGLAAATVNKRRTALMHLLTQLDGKDAPNPVRAVPKFRVPDPLPRGRSMTLLKRAIGSMSCCPTRARCKVLLWTGMRPDELRRAQPDDLNLSERYIIVRTGKGGRARTIPFGQDGFAAWREFVALKAWGPFTSAPANRMLKAACALVGLAGVALYDLRHSFGTRLCQLGVPLNVVAALLGHSNLELTRRYLLAAVPMDVTPNDDGGVTITFYWPNTDAELDGRTR